jgi:hypothetical protein
MKMTWKISRRGIAAGGAVLAAAAGLALVATPASATQRGQLTLCSHGSYASYAEITDQNNVIRRKTDLVQPGQCDTVSTLNLQGASWGARVLGRYHTSPKDFVIGGPGGISIFPDNAYTLRTYGSTTNAGADASWTYSVNNGPERRPPGE